MYSPKWPAPQPFWPRPPVQPEALPERIEIEHAGADQRAENLSDPVAHHLARAHAAGGEHAEADRRIDVAAGDRPDAIGHGDDGEAESAGDAEQVDRGRARPMPPIDRRPAAEKHKCKGPDEFRELLVH